MFRLNVVKSTGVPGNHSYNKLVVSHSSRKFYHKIIFASVRQCRYRFQMKTKPIKPEHSKTRFTRDRLVYFHNIYMVIGPRQAQNTRYTYTSTSRRTNRAFFQIPSLFMTSCRVPYFTGSHSNGREIILHRRIHS